MAKGSRRPLVAGAVALAASGAVASTIGAVYHIIVVRVAGAEALGLFQMAMPIYRVAAGAASLGFHIAVVRLVADSLGRGRPEQARAHARSALRAALASGPAAAILIWLAAPILAVSLFRDARLIPAIACLGLLLIPATAGSVLAGVVQGFGGASSLAWAGIAEAVLRVPSVLAMLTLLAPLGAGAMAAAMIGGMVVGEVGSLAMLWIKARQLLEGDLRLVRAPRAEAALFRLGIPLMVSGLFNSVVNLVNASLVPRQLQSAGLTQTGATQAFGQMSGMVAPLVYMPMLFVGPVVQVVTPAVAELLGSDRRDRVVRLLRKAFLIAGAIGLAWAALLVLVPGHIGRILYGAPQIAPLVRPLAAAAPFVYIGMISSGVLIGAGQVGPVTVNVFVGNITRTALILTLVSRPTWGILGAIWAMVADHVVTAVLNIACLGWFMSARLARISHASHEQDAASRHVSNGKEERTVGREYDGHVYRG
ncbi:MAG: Stage V sporulation protein B [Firmicutes bacterium ADurb.Bin506]|jgi:stage V sporulation protein B|nr:MAG: Stage V sporulation protein B [Firmicutes bacterium ADurb.Bin506]